MSRISQQKGHFRHVTEKELEQEIKDNEIGKVQEEESDEEEVKEALPDGRTVRDNIIKAKAEMIQQVSLAQNEALMALDFVSLLISRDLPQRADLTMSALLKESVPKGTLGYDKWDELDPNVKEQKNGVIVAQGWNMKNLNSAADSLLDAARSLEREVERETKYWDAVMSLTENGWSVHKASGKEKHALRVQFGSMDAGPQFQARGSAILRSNDDGSVYLDQGIAMRPKAVRVRVAQNGKIIGSSSITSTDVSSSDLETL
ncbi:hypothetical protein LTS18_002505, partial [Coniosporium uncinatum]